MYSYCITPDPSETDFIREMQSNVELDIAESQNMTLHFLKCMWEFVYIICTDTAYFTCLISDD